MRQSAMGYAASALENPEKFPKDFAENIAWLIIKGEIVISQTERRVINGEKVPGTEKLLSIFKTHADVIVKDNRDTFYGHNICLMAGKSSLVFEGCIPQTLLSLLR